MEVRLDHQTQKIASRQKLITKVLVFRLFYLLCMIVSCAVFPDHNPGDDVLRFNLRLDGLSPCFCLLDQSCARSTSIGVEGTVCNDASTVRLPRSLWKRLLSPFTKWDAARFLSIALQPQSRYPPLSCAQGDRVHCDFAKSEQAHAFFPFFPTLLKSAAIFWMNLVPDFLLPPTYECLLVMTGVFINILCLIIGCLALYSLTLSILPAAVKPNDRHRVASAACLVYGIWNPASVFFATNYSESLFGALVLSGHMAFSQKMYWLALPCWMLASWTRSNGSMHALWFVVQCLGNICQYIQSRGNSVGFVQMIANAVVYLGGAALILLPVRYHDLNGYAAHCDMDAKIRPQWCQNESSSFSLYAWVQRQHWNVGPFHYYEVKQIPNFLLAAPILILSIVGVFRWIENSVFHFGRGKLPNSPYLLLVGWPLEALSCFVERADARTREDERTKDAHIYLIGSPALLGHYAILAVLTVLSVVVAHIQISTRMIMSSTPAIVWFLTYCHLQPEGTLLRRLVSAYTILFLFLGVVLHVNFLPWT